MAEDENYTKPVLNKAGISEDDLKKNGEHLVLDLYLKFENSIALSEAHTLLEIIELNEQKRLFPVPLHNRQNKTKREIFYPNIKLDIKNALYVLDRIFDIVDYVREPIKQTELVKILGDGIDKEKVKGGLWFLSEYGFFKRWTEKNRVWLQLNIDTYI